MLKSFFFILLLHSALLGSTVCGSIATFIVWIGWVDGNGWSCTGIIFFSAGILWIGISLLFIMICNQLYRMIINSMAMRFFLRLQRTESEPAPCNVCTLRKDLAILTRDRTTSIIYILIIFAVSKIHVILGTAITMIGKAFSLHLRSSQRRSKRKKML